MISRPGAVPRCILCCFLCFELSAASGPPAPDRAAVGMEGRVERTLPGTLLEAKVVDPRAPLLVRIASTRPHGTLIYYDIRYIGLEPGKYDLRDYLVRKDGSASNDLPALTVAIFPVLPPDHAGELIPPAENRLRLFGGYRILLGTGVALWLIGGMALVRHRRKTVPSAGPAPVRTPPTLAERLQPLLEQAAAGRLSREGQAQLERMLLSYWKDRKGLGALGMSEALAALKKDPEAGALLLQLERWLHRPPGSEAIDVAALLEPYRQSAPSPHAHPGAETPAGPAASKP